MTTAKWEEEDGSWGSNSVNSKSGSSSRGQQSPKCSETLRLSFCLAIPLAMQIRESGQGRTHAIGRSIAKTGNGEPLCWPKTLTDLIGCAGEEMSKPSRGTASSLDSDCDCREDWGGGVGRSRLSRSTACNGELVDPSSRVTDAEYVSVRQALPKV
nr:hypothetical protein CFP56_07752 [Quercus suber]